MCRTLMLILLASVTTGIAQPLTWPYEGIPVRAGTRILCENQLVPGPDGLVLTVWSDSRTGDRDIYAQAIDPQTGPVWPDGGVRVADELEIQGEAMACATDDGWIVGWVDYRADHWWPYGDYGGDTYVQKLDVNGVPQWSPGGIVVSLDNDGIVYGSLSVLPDGANGAFVTWREYVDNGNGHEIFCRRVDANGILQWPQTLLVSADTGYVYEPAVSADGAGSLWVTWGAPSSTINDVVVQRVTRDGQLAFPGGARPVCNCTGSQSLPEISMDGAGGCYIIWRDYRSGDHYEVFAQRMNDLGLRMWDTTGVRIGIPGLNVGSFAVAPSRTGDNPDGVLVIWSNYILGSPTPVLAQKLNAQGVAQWGDSAVELASGAAGYPSNLAITTDGAGGAVAAWTRDGADAQIQTFAHRILANGSLSWGESEVEILPHDPQRRGGAIVWDGASGVLISWLGFNSDGQTLRVQRAQLSDGASLWNASTTALIEGLEGNPSAPFVVPLSNARTAVVWWDHRSWYGPSPVFYQILDTLSNVLLTANGEELVPDSTGFESRNSAYPFACVDGAGGFFAVLTSARNGVQVVRLTHVNADGERTCGDGGVVVWDDPAAQSQHSPRCAPDGQGGCYVAWYESLSSGDAVIRVLRFSETCAPLWEQPTQLNRGVNLYDFLNYIAADEAGRCLITWEYGEYAARRIAAARVSPDGSVDWEVDAATGSGYLSTSRIASDGDSGAYVVWTEILDYPNSNIFAQHIGNSGERLWTNTGLPVAATALQEDFDSLAVDSRGQLIIVITTSLRPGSRLSAHKFASNGTPLWGNDGLTLCAGEGWPGRASAVLDPRDGLFVVWEDSREDQPGLYGAHVDSAGLWTINPYWEPGVGGEIRAHDGIPPRDPAIAPDGSGGFVTVWWDGRDEMFSTWTQLFAQRVRDIPIPDATDPSPVLPGRFELTQNVPNPFNSATRIQFSLPRSVRVQLRLFDITGRTVMTLADRVFDAGEHTLSVDASALPSGLYFYRLTAGSFSQTRKMVLIR